MSSSAAAPDVVVRADASLRRPGLVGPIGRLLTWRAAAGWPGVALVVGVWLALIAWGQAVLWANGRLPVGSIDPQLAVLSAYTPYGIAATIVGSRIAAGALRRFWPATGWPDSERDDWTRRFMSLPAGAEWLVLAFGAVVGLGALAAAPAGLLGPEIGRSWTYLAYLPTYVLGYAILAAGTFIALRWLGLVARIHREAAAIDPFDRGPIYAFSRVTGWAGLVYLGGIYYTLAFNSSLQGQVFGIAFLAISMLVSVLAFVVPLWGIHTRLIQAKAELLSDLDRRASALSAEMYARIDAGAFDSTKVVSDSIGGLGLLRDRIEHLPTWPWPPQLLRGFLSALLLPVVVYVVTRVISNLLA